MFLELKFIELTLTDKKEPICINVSYISCVLPSPDGYGGTRICERGLKEDSFWEVEESYAEVIACVRGCVC